MNNKTNRIESNKLIMEFMDIEPSKIGDSYSLTHGVFFSSRNRIKEKVIKSYANYAKYDSSWDWLMPVVQRCFIEDVLMNDENLKLYVNIEKGLNRFNLRTVYEEVITFIKWYYYIYVTQEQEK